MQLTQYIKKKSFSIYVFKNNNKSGISTNPENFCNKSFAQLLSLRVFVASNHPLLPQVSQCDIFIPPFSLSYTPYIIYGCQKALHNRNYPQTNSICALKMVLCFRKSGPNVSARV